MLKLRGLGLMGLLVFSGVTVGALHAFAQTHKSTTQAKPPHQPDHSSITRHIKVVDLKIKKHEDLHPRP